MGGVFLVQSPLVLKMRRNILEAKVLYCFNDESRCMPELGLLIDIQSITAIELAAFTLYSNLFT